MIILAGVAEWYETVGGIISLITSLVGLIGTGLGAFFAVKAFIKSLKGKSFNQIWSMIMKSADEAMKAAEASDKSGADKKQMVIDSVKAGLVAAGIDITPFIDQLNAYIDQTITFVNGMTK